MLFANAITSFYPTSLLQFLSFIDAALLELNEELKELFVEQVYSPIEDEIVQYIRVELIEGNEMQRAMPKDLREIASWKSQLTDV